MVVVVQTSTLHTDFCPYIYFYCKFSSSYSITIWKVNFRKLATWIPILWLLGERKVWDTTFLFWNLNFEYKGWLRNPHVFPLISLVGWNWFPQYDFNVLLLLCKLWALFLYAFSRKKKKKQLLGREVSEFVTCNLDYSLDLTFFVMLAI